MANGILIIDKPTDWTSHDVVAKLRGILHEKRIGHAGTLDPMATGVLPVFVGRATRAVEFAAEREKEYLAGLRLGQVTDTQDVTGSTLSTAPVSVTREDVEKILAQFLGDIRQIPPMYSAIKKEGKKLYELARRGQEVERQPRPITIYELELLDQLSPTDYTLRVKCSKGTYVRTLCHDIGQMIGCGAHMGLLLRAQTGAFTLDDAHTIEEIAACGDLSQMMTPMDRPLAHLPRADVLTRAERFVRNGNALNRNEIRGEIPQGAPVRLYLRDQLAGIGRMNGDQFKFDAMLLE